MITYYTSLGQYLIQRNKKGQSYPVVVVLGKEYQLTIAEMILWTKCTWNVCSLNFLCDSFAHEEKILGDMNFEFILNRLIQRGLIIAASAPTEDEALHALVDNLVVNPADFSIASKLKAFLTLVFTLKVAFNKAKEVLKKPILTEHEDRFLSCANQSPKTVAEIATLMDIDDYEFLTLVANLYSSKFINFSTKARS